MNDYTMTSDIVLDSFSSLWGSVGAFLPRFLVALVLFLVGWLLAIILAKVVWHAVKFLQLDRGLESIGLRSVVERSGHKLDSGLVFYHLVKWFVVILALMVASNILGLDEVTQFLQTVAFYIPNVFIAALILLVGVMVARFLESLVRGSVRAASLASGNFLGMLTRWAVLVFSFLIALEQLQVATDIIRIAVTGVIVAAALGFGLAFGLGGRDHAEEVIAHWRKHTKE